MACIQKTSAPLQLAPAGVLAAPLSASRVRYREAGGWNPLNAFRSRCTNSMVRANSAEKKRRSPPRPDVPDLDVRGNVRVPSPSAAAPEAPAPPPARSASSAKTRRFLRIEVVGDHHPHLSGAPAPAARAACARGVSFLLCADPEKKPSRIASTSRSRCKRVARSRCDRPSAIARADICLEQAARPRANQEDWRSTRRHFIARLYHKNYRL